MNSPTPPPPIPFNHPFGSDPAYQRPGKGQSSTHIGLAIAGFAVAALAAAAMSLPWCFADLSMPIAILGICLSLGGVIAGLKRGPMVWLPISAAVVCVVVLSIAWAASNKRESAAKADEQAKQLKEQQALAAIRAAQARDAAELANLHLPPFTVTSDKLEKPFSGNDTRTLEVTASGDLNGTNAYQILDYVKKKYPAGFQHVTMFATAQNGDRYTILTSHFSSANVDGEQLAAYRKAAGLATTTQPAR